VAGRSIVPELLQGDARPDRIAEALVTLLDGDAAAAQCRALAEAAVRLGPGGAAARASAIAEAMLGAGAT
jgi:lipid-A-disaccharide synthase